MSEHHFWTCPQCGNQYPSKDIRDAHQADDCEGEPPTDVVNLRLSVEVPAGTNAEHVAHRLNAMLDEPPCDWGDWSVGAVVLDTYQRDDTDPADPAWGDCAFGVSGEQPAD